MRTMFVFDGRLVYMSLNVITVFGLGVVISMRCYVCDGAGECCDVGDVCGYFAADAVRDCDVTYDDCGAWCDCWRGVDYGWHVVDDDDDGAVECRWRCRCRCR